MILNTEPRSPEEFSFGLKLCYLRANVFGRTIFVVWICNGFWLTDGVFHHRSHAQARFKPWRLLRRTEFASIVPIAMNANIDGSGTACVIPED